MSQFEIYFTTLYGMLWDDVTDPDNPVIIPDPARPAIKLSRAWQFSDADLEAPWGPNPREFNFKVPIYDSVHDRIKKHLSHPNGIEAYKTLVYVEWRGHPVFWGPIVDPQWHMKDGYVDLRCYSPLKRWEFHFLRNGDAAIASGGCTLDYRGIRLLRDAAENSYPQIYPPVGIKNGVNTASTRTQKVKLERGQQVLRAANDIVDSSWGPEMLEVPLAFGSNPPYYAQINTADALEMGTDRYNQLVFQGGYGIDNLDDVIYTPGGKLITHAHALDRNGKHRETRSDPDAAMDYGVWVSWEATDFEVTTSQADDVLGNGVAQTLVDYYSRPPKFATLILKKDNAAGVSHQKYWLDDFFHGDFLRASVKKGGMYLPDQPYRITGTGLHQEDQGTGVRQRIDVVPRVTAITGGDDGG